MSQFRDAFAQFARLGCTVVGCSIDAVSSQKPWAEKLNLPFPLMSDANRDLGHALGDFLLPEVAGIRGVYMRAALVLDPDGVVRWRWGVDTKTLPDVPAVLAAVRKVVQA